MGIHAVHHETHRPLAWLSYPLSMGLVKQMDPHIVFSIMATCAQSTKQGCCVGVQLPLAKYNTQELWSEQPSLHYVTLEILFPSQPRTKSFLIFSSSVNFPTGRSSLPFPQ